MDRIRKSFFTIFLLKEGGEETFKARSLGQPER
jgi:hypothetical protein